MSSNNGLNTSNVKRLVAPIDYVIKGNDDVLDIDTSSGGITNLYLTNIRDSGYERISKRYFINDVGNNASIGKINIIADPSNTINNASSFALESDGIGAEVQISDRTRWLACLNSDVSGGLNVIHDSSLFGNGTTLIPLGVNGVYKNVLFVSQFGNDTIAEKGRISLAFRTLQYAKTKADQGDLIYVFAGIYDIDQSLTAHNVTYYFQPNAIVKQKNCWVLNDRDVVMDGLVTTILGYGDFILDSELSTYGHSNIENDHTKFKIEFNSITVNSKQAFKGVKGEFYIRGKYINSSASFVVDGRGICVWDFAVDVIDNIGVVAGHPNYIPSIFMRDLDTPTGALVESRFAFTILNNNANTDFATVYLINCKVLHEVIVQGKIVLTLGKEKPKGVGSTLCRRDGGILRYSGEIRSDSSIAKIFGNNVSPIIINNSNCYCYSSEHVLNPICVNGDRNWITIKDSLVKTFSTLTVVGIGFDPLVGDTQSGSVEILNTVLANIYDDRKDACSGIVSRRDSGKGYTILDDLTVYIAVDYGGTYCVTSNGYGTVQKISILGGNLTSTHNREFNVNNNVTGTNIFVKNDILINPLR